MSKVRSGARVVALLATVVAISLSATGLASATVDAKKKPKPKAVTTTTTKPATQTRTIKGTFSMENGCEYVTSGGKKTWVILDNDDTHQIANINGEVLFFGKDDDELDGWLYGDKSPDDPRLLYPGDTFTVTGVVIPPGGNATSCLPYDDRMTVKAGDWKLG